MVAVQSLAIAAFALAMRGMAARMDRMQEQIDTDMEGLAKKLRDGATPPSSRTGLRRGTLAPQFELETTAGHTASLSDYSEHRLLLVFGKTGCTPCHTLMEEIARVTAGKQSDEWDRVLAIVHGSPAEVRADAIAGIPTAIDEQGEVLRRFGVAHPPACTLVGRDGRVMIAGAARTVGDVEKLIGSLQKSRQR